MPVALSLVMLANIGHAFAVCPGFTALVLVCVLGLAVVMFGLACAVFAVPSRQATSNASVRAIPAVRASIVATRNLRAPVLAHA